MTEPMAIAPLRAPALDAASGVRHGFFTRAGGVSTGLYASLNIGLGSKDDPEAVRENRRRAAKVLGVTASALLTCHQTHSAVAVVASSPFDGAPPRADAVVTRTPGLACAALSADCAPVLFFDPEARVAAAAHAGWRGALSGVLEAAVHAMAAEGASPRRIIAAVGPCIGPQSYEVGLEFLTQFTEQDPGSARYFANAEKPDKRLFDLPGYVIRRLERAGVGEASWLGRDTYMEADLFFSNRRAVRAGEADYGRLVSAIVLA